MKIPICVFLAAAVVDGAAANELVVTGFRHEATASSPVISISEADIARAGAVSLADAVRLAPGMVVRTNSRGETLPFFPATGEREAAVFLGAAPLNVAWDNRVDIAILPANAVSLRVARAAGAAGSGLRVTSGRIDVAPSLRSDDGVGAAARIEGATGPRLAFEGALQASSGATRAVLAGGLVDDAGARVADPLRTPFSQASKTLRTNDDLRRASVLAHFARSMGSFEVEATALYAEAMQGAPPESDRDPVSSSVRYWRYPEQRFLSAGAEAEYVVSDDASAGLAVWGQTFEQTIDSFTSATYATLASRQVDDNAALGGRWYASIASHGVAATLEGGGSVATHDERVEDGAGVPGPTERYREVAIFGGGALEAGLAGGELRLRGGVDHLSTPLTAGRARQPDFTRPYASVEWTRAFGGGWSVETQAALKTRPPTLRELYGVALGRFLPNPDLKPETSWYGEAGVGIDRRRFSASATGFVRFVDDTLEQRSVRVGSRTLRQRVNLDGSRSWGSTVRATWRPIESLTVSGDRTFLHERPQGDPPLVARLTERPGVVAHLRGEYARGPLRLTAEGERFGAVYSLDGAGALVRLDAGTFLNFRAALALAPGAEVYVRADNALDAFHEPQAGLPADGRRIALGVSLRR